jgi:hypothetical protein
LPLVLLPLQLDKSHCVKTQAWENSEISITFSSENLNRGLYVDTDVGGIIILKLITRK